MVYEHYKKFTASKMSNLVTRRSLKAPHLAQICSKGVWQHAKNNELSCPNSPAVKKAYRLVVLGSARTGKSAIVSRFLEEEFDERYIPTIENFHRKIYKSRGELYQLDIMDRSGNDPFPAARRLAYMNGDLFLLISAFDNAQSVAQLVEIYNQIVECKSTWPSSAQDLQKINVLFVVNKSDLSATKREISSDEVREVLRDVLLTPEHLVECSAKCSTQLNQKVFGRIFTFAKLPKFMNPEHKALRAELSEDGTIERDRHHSLRNVLSFKISFAKEFQDEVIVNKNLRRPSLRTDLLVSRAKSCSYLFQPKQTQSSNNFLPHSRYRSPCFSDSQKKREVKLNSVNQQQNFVKPANQAVATDKNDSAFIADDIDGEKCQKRKTNNNVHPHSSGDHHNITPSILLDSLVNSTKRCAII